MFAFFLLFSVFLVVLVCCVVVFLLSLFFNHNPKTKQHVMRVLFLLDWGGICVVFFVVDV